VKKIDRSTRTVEERLDSQQLHTDSDHMDHHYTRLTMSPNTPNTHYRYTVVQLLNLIY